MLNSLKLSSEQNYDPLGHPLKATQHIWKRKKKSPSFLHVQNAPNFSRMGENRGALGTLEFCQQFFASKS